MQIAAFVFFWILVLSPQSLRADEGPGVDETWVRLLYLTHPDSESVDAGAELKKFLHELQAPKALGDEHVACHYPARTLWLERKAPAFFRKLDLPACPKFSAWLEQIRSDRAYLLFAAQFLNSPASMYGHTLLQLGRSGSTKGEAILDYVVAYGADSGNSGGIAYLWNGLTGGFNGKFSTVPYYLKIREYNDAESRDIWAYELKLSPEQMALLVRHVWEIRSSEFPYYFLGKNCSYFLLRLLDVVGTGPSLTEGLPAWTIPTDTIRALKNAGWIGERSRRASRSRRLFARRALLNAEERGKAERLGVEKKDASGIARELEPLNLERQSMVLDTAFDLHRYRLGGKIPTPEDQARERALLQARAKNSIAPRELELGAGEPPEESHLSNRWAISLGRDERKPEAEPRYFADFEWRPAIQDILSDPFALDHYGEQEILRTQWRVTNRPRTRIFLESLDILRIRALSPLDAWSKKPSWRFRLGTGTERSGQCVDWNCLYGRLELGGGASVALFADDESILFGLLSLRNHLGPGAGERSWRMGAGPELGFKLKIFSSLRLLGEAEWTYYALGQNSWSRHLYLGASISLGKSSEWRIEAQESDGNNEIRSGFFRFF